MQISDLLRQMGGAGVLARELGVDERQARSGAEALLPAILGGFKQQAQAQPAGAGGLAGMFGGQRTAQPARRDGAGGLAAMLDMDGDGNPLNDVLGMLGKLKR